MKTKNLVILGLSCLLLIACDKQIDEKTQDTVDDNKVTEETALPSGHPAAGVSQSPQPGQVINSGIVKESFIGGGYTYAAIEVNNQVVWMAGPAVKLAIGSQVGWKDATLMENFSSPSLNRTFDQIYFISSFMQPQAVELNIGQVEEMIASAGYTYIKVKTDTKSVWLAAPETVVAKGETIQWEGGAVMRNFKSNSLDRIFDEIVFVDKITKS